MVEHYRKLNRLARAGLVIFVLSSFVNRMQDTIMAGVCAFAIGILFLTWTKMVPAIVGK